MLVKGTPWRQKVLAESMHCMQVIVFIVYLYDVPGYGSISSSDGSSSIGYSSSGYDVSCDVSGSS